VSIPIVGETGSLALAVLAFCFTCCTVLAWCGWSVALTVAALCGPCFRAVAILRAPTAACLAHHVLPLLVWWVTLTYGYVWGLVWFVQGVPSLVLLLTGGKLAAGNTSRCSPV
jgi:hypothetical protein